MYTPEGQATILYALEGLNLFVSLATLERRAKATEKEFGKHAIRRAIHGTLKTRKSLCEVLNLGKRKKPGEKAAGTSQRLRNPVFNHKVSAPA
jgi:hypothetical protein